MKQREFTSEELSSLYVVVDISEGGNKPLFFKWDEKSKSSYAEEGIEGASLYELDKAIEVINENNIIEGVPVNAIRAVSNYSSDLDVIDL